MKKNIGIIGAGPVGIYLSYLLVQKGHRVTLYEAGNMDLESSNLNMSHYIFKTKSKIPKGVHRVGGGANLWKRRVSEFAPEVFNRTSLTGERVWPIEFQELEIANEKLFKELHPSGLRDQDFLNIFLNEADHSFPRSLNLVLYRFCEQNFFNNLLEKLRCYSNFELLTTTLVSEICLKSKPNVNQDFVELILYRENSEATSSKFHSDVVLTGGCLQSTALALKSKDIINMHPAPELIGKYLMEHFDGYVGTLRIKRKNLKILKNIVLDEDRKIPGRNFGIGISNPITSNIGDPQLAYHLELVKWRKTYLFDPNLNIFNGLPDNLYRIFFFLERLLKKIPSEIRNFYFRLTFTEIYSVWLKGEELPFFDSDLKLSRNTEPKFAKLIYNHRISKQTKKIMRRRLLEFSAHLRKHNLGKFKIHSYFRFNRLFYTGPNFHPMGSLRMGSNPKDSVISPDFSFHGSPRVFAVNSGIFPNGSNHNPTTMVLALSHIFASKI